MGICRDCIYWEEMKQVPGKVLEGICCKNPPNSTGCFMPAVDLITQQVKPQLIEITTWPVTKATKWCGEFKAKQEPLKVEDVEKIFEKQKPGRISKTTFNMGEPTAIV